MGRACGSCTVRDVERTAGLVCLVCPEARKTGFRTCGAGSTDFYGSIRAHSDAPRADPRGSAAIRACNGASCKPVPLTLAKRACDGSGVIAKGNRACPLGRSVDRRGRVRWAPGGSRWAGVPWHRRWLLRWPLRLWWLPEGKRLTRPIEGCGCLVGLKMAVLRWAGVEGREALRMATGTYRWGRAAA